MNNFVKRFSQVVSIILGLIALIVVLVVSLALLEDDIAVAIVTTGGAIIIAIFSAIWQRNTEKLQQIEEKIREKKTPLYEQYIKIAFEMLYSGTNRSKQENPQRSKPNQTNNNEDSLEKLRKLTPELIIWGTDEVIRSWIDFRNITSGKNDTTNVMLSFERFLFAIRKDLGHKPEMLNKGDLLRIFINDVDKILDQRSDT